MKQVLGLIRFTWRYFSGCTFFGMLLYCVAPLLLGLATRTFFDRVSGPSRGPVWVAVAFVAAVLVGEVLSELAIGRTWSGFCYETHTLLERNALAGILRGFGRFGLPVSPGDAISRFRDEPPNITMGSMDGIADLIGRVITELKRTRVSIDRLHALMPGEPRDAVVAHAPIHVRGPLPTVAPVPAGGDPLERLDVLGLTCRHRRGVKLSGGQVQRAAAARMFLQPAELLVLDDLSSALDVDTEAELWRRLLERRGEVTCLVVSHSPIAVANADRVVVLENGRVRSSAATASRSRRGASPQAPSPSPTSRDDRLGRS